MKDFKIVLSSIDVIIISINIFIYMITSIVFGYIYSTTRIINLDSVVILTLVPLMIITFIFCFTYSNKKIYLLQLCYNKVCSIELNETSKEKQTSEIQTEILNRLNSLSQSHFYALLFSLMNFILCFYLQYDFITIIFTKLF